MPQRLQFKRIKGFRLPAGAIRVTRPSRWGNPFIAGQYFADFSVLRILGYDVSLRSIAEKGVYVRDNAHAVELYREYLVLYQPVHLDLLLLQGKDLACFCKLDAVCHADVLLELANAPSVAVV